MRGCGKVGVMLAHRLEVFCKADEAECSWTILLGNGSIAGLDIHGEEETVMARELEIVNMEAGIRGITDLDWQDLDKWTESRERSTGNFRREQVRVRERSREIEMANVMSTVFNEKIEG
eukprot:g42242.t1